MDFLLEELPVVVVVVVVVLLADFLLDFVISSSQHPHSTVTPFFTFLDGVTQLVFAVRPPFFEAFERQTAILSGLSSSQ